MVFALATLFISFKKSESYTFESFTILRASLAIGGAWLECSLIAGNKTLKASDIIWLNETNQSYKDDKDINTLNAIVASGASTWKLDSAYEDLSCGYTSQSEYVRIKKWKLTYVSRASIELSHIIVDDNFKMNKINSSLCEVDYNPVENLFAISSSRDILRLFCNRNFDMPTMSPSILLHLEELSANGELISDELWISGTDLYFTNYKDEQQEFIYFLKKLITSTEQRMRIYLKCIIENPYLKVLENSGNFYLVKRSTISENSSLKKDNLAMILSLVFGFVGLILLVAIIIFIIRNTKAKTLRNKSTDKENIVTATN